MGVSQTSFELHVTVAVVAAPPALTRASGEVLTAPLASFQLGSATTPATSVEVIAMSSPTKSILITLLEPVADATSRTAVVVLVSEPLVPVMVKVKAPVGVLLSVVIVSVELPPALAEVGLKLPVALAGKPLTLKLTAAVNPLTTVRLTTYGVFPPGLTV
jgi:hypothetical protein